LRGMRRPEVNRTVATVGERLGITPLLGRRRHELSDGEVQRVAVARALGLEPDLLLLDEPVSSADRAAAQTLYRALEEERRRRPLAICLASHQLEDAYRWADDVRALAEGRLSPVTPENLFRVELPLEGASGLKHVRVGTVLIATVTDRTGPAILAVPPTDIFVSRQPGSRRGRMQADSAAVEEVPVWLEVNGEPTVTWMCTPDQLEELATGWLHGEGYIETMDDLLRMRPCATDPGFWADVKPERVAFVKRQHKKRVLASGCGAVSTFLADPPALKHAPARGEAPAPERLRALFKDVFTRGDR